VTDFIGAQGHNAQTKPCQWVAGPHPARTFNGLSGLSGRPSLTFSGASARIRRDRRQGANATPVLFAPHRGPDQYLTDLFRRERLSAGQKLALRAIARFADWGTGECFPGEARLADEMGCSTRTVRRHMSALEERGIIAAKRRARERGRGSYTQVIVLVEYANGMSDQQDNRCPDGPDDQQDNLERPTGQQMSASEEELHLRTSLPPRAPHVRASAHVGGPRAGLKVFSRQ
jgi:hypothetical protein